MCIKVLGWMSEPPSHKIIGGVSYEFSLNVHAVMHTVMISSLAFFHRYTYAHSLSPQSPALSPHSLPFHFIFYFIFLRSIVAFHLFYIMWYLIVWDILAGGLVGKQTARQTIEAKAGKQPILNNGDGLTLNTLVLNTAQYVRRHYTHIYILCIVRCIVWSTLL